MHFYVNAGKMHRMSSSIVLQADLGKLLSQRRIEAGHSIQSLAKAAGKSRAVIYRLERGEPSEVSSLLAVVAALGLSLTFQKAELPTLAETAGFFDEDGDAA